MSDMGDMYNVVKQERQQDSQRRRDHNAAIFEQARDYAASHGMILWRCSDVQYQLCGGNGWLINLYPGNQRIFRDINKPRAPRLSVSCEWDLMDVVKEAARLADASKMVAGRVTR